ncbi:hypothetical protein NDU88_002768 [Pleurodeles waltl]|uniref:Uncharacterized protein n=1 Tax=Pleurodeles waltl TaxID=8319 RepID=A0AAV7MNM5_PLEWA|nr:hypothetical protein NDU88_002768 [Pleurodeles waltl]
MAVASRAAGPARVAEGHIDWLYSGGWQVADSAKKGEGRRRGPTRDNARTTQVRCLVSAGPSVGLPRRPSPISLPAWIVGHWVLSSRVPWRGRLHIWCVGPEAVQGSRLRGGGRGAEVRKDPASHAARPKYSEMAKTTIVVPNRLPPRCGKGLSHRMA